MAIFEWKSEYDTGISEIDIQHMVLVSLINELHSLVNEHLDIVQAKQIVEKLKNHAVFHFATEEALMDQYHYEASDHDLHIAQHRQFEGEFESVLADFENITLDECNIVLSYLTNWLTNHICKVDRRFAQHVHKLREADNQDVIHYTKEELVAMTVSEGTEGGVILSLQLTQKHVETTDQILEQLDACIDELKSHCDLMVQSTTDSSFSNMSSIAHSQCSNGLKLIESIKSNQASLKNLLDQVGGNN